MPLLWLPITDATQGHTNVPLYGNKYNMLYSTPLVRWQTSVRVFNPQLAQVRVMVVGCVARNHD